MRKWVAAALVAMAVLAASCQRGGDEGSAPATRAATVIEPETRVDTVPQEEPAVARQQWRSANDRARSIAGNLRVSLEGNRGGPVVFAFANGITVRAQPFDVTPADSRSGVQGQSFAAVLGGDPRVEVYLYRVLDENVTASAAQGGLCGEAVTRGIAVSEFVDGSGRWVLKLAAFSGELATQARGDPQLCNAFAFTAQ